MPSTYTLNNGIELIATGEQSGTWGDTTNTNFQLLDTSLDGQVTVTLASTGSSGSPNTLPVSDGAASNGRNRLVIFDDSSDLGGTAFVQLTPSDAEKIIYVRNSLSGSRSILLFQGTYSASNDYEVPAGTTAVVFFNGAGSGAVAANVMSNAHFDNLNIAGDVTIGDDLSLNSDGAIINIGADADLQVTHSGSAGTITNATGNLTIDTTASDTDIIFKGTDGASDITAFTLDMSEGGRAIFRAGLLSNDTNDIRKAQITSQYDSSSFLRLHPSATTDSGGYTNMFFGTSTDNNYGVAIGGLRAGSDSTPSFRIRTHNDSITGVDVLTINNSGVSTFRSGAVFNENSDDADFRVESNNQANMIFVDAGNDRVGIQTAIPSTTLQVDGLDDGDIAWFRGNGSNAGGRALRFGVGNTTRTEFPTYLPNIYSTSSDSANGGLAIGMYGGTSGEGAIQFWTGDSSSFAEKMRIQRAGNIVAQYGAVFNEGSNNSDFRVESDSNANALFVDAGADHVNIGTSSDFGGVLNVNGTIAMNGAGEVAGFFDLSAGITHSGDNVVAFSSGTSGSTQHSAVALWADDHSQYSGQIHLVGNTSNGGSVNAAGEVEFWTFNGSTYTLESYMGPRGYVFNEASRNVDFRVESDSNANALFVDASQSYVGVNTSSLDIMFEVGMSPTSNITNNTQTSLGNFGGSSRMGFSGLGSNNDGVYFGMEAIPAGIGFMREASGWDTQLRFYTNSITSGPDGTNAMQEKLRIGSTSTVFNETGRDHDFRVESDGNANMLFLDASANKIGIGSSSFNYGTALTVHGNEDAGTPSSVFLRNSGTSGGSGNRIECGYVTGYGAAIRFSGNPSSYRMYGTYFERITGDGPTYATSGEFGTTGIFKTYEGVVHNENGGDKDFRVESDNYANLFTIDAGNDCVNIGANNGSSANWLYVYEPTAAKTTAAAFNVATTSSFSGSNAMRINTHGYYSANFSHRGIQFKNFDSNAGRSNVEQQFINHANTVVGSVVTTTTGTSFNTTSDYRLKENVVDLTGATERLAQIPVHRFNFIESPDITQDGFLAHEVAAVVPDAVVGEKDAVNNQGNPDYQTMDNSRLVPLLVATIKELEARITALENA